MPKTNKTIEERFWSFVDKTSDDCWIWRGYITNKGYGQFSENGYPILAHRKSWVLNFGEFDSKLCVCTNAIIRHV